VKSLRILITGASSGIGAATAHLLAERGHRIYALARNESALQELASAHPEGRIEWAQVDVTDDSAVRTAVAAMVDSWGGIDVCIPNAGLGIFSPLPEARFEDWKTMVDVNITGVLATLHAALPSLVANKGHVIQIGSIAARNVFPNSGVYCATKHAVLALSESLRMEFREDLAVTTINPGAVNTAFIDQTNNDTLRESYRPQFEAGMEAAFIAEAIAQAIEAQGRGVFSEITVRPDRR
jgi:NADP-dependent 3-hydroxy acid dehydrogenase YdfG